MSYDLKNTFMDTVGINITLMTAVLADGKYYAFEKVHVSARRDELSAMNAQNFFSVLKKCLNKSFLRTETPKTILELLESSNAAIVPLVQVTSIANSYLPLLSELDFSIFNEEIKNVSARRIELLIYLIPNSHISCEGPLRTCAKLLEKNHDAVILDSGKFTQGSKVDAAVKPVSNLAKTSDSSTEIPVVTPTACETKQSKLEGIRTERLNIMKELNTKIEAVKNSISLVKIDKRLAEIEEKMSELTVFKEQTKKPSILEPTTTQPLQPAQNMLKNTKPVKKTEQESVKWSQIESVIHNPLFEPTKEKSPYRFDALIVDKSDLGIMIASDTKNFKVELSVDFYDKRKPIRDQKSTTDNVLILSYPGYFRCSHEISKFNLRVVKDEYEYIYVPAWSLDSGMIFSQGGFLQIVDDNTPSKKFILHPKNISSVNSCLRISGKYWSKIRKRDVESVIQNPAELASLPSYNGNLNPPIQLLMHDKKNLTIHIFAQRENIRAEVKITFSNGTETINLGKHTEGRFLTFNLPYPLEGGKYITSFYLFVTEGDNNYIFKPEWRVDGGIRLNNAAFRSVIDDRNLPEKKDSFKVGSTDDKAKTSTVCEESPKPSIPIGTRRYAEVKTNLSKPAPNVLPEFTFQPKEGEGSYFNNKQLPDSITAWICDYKIFTVDITSNHSNLKVTFKVTFKSDRKDINEESYTEKNRLRMQFPDYFNCSSDVSTFDLRVKNGQNDYIYKPTWNDKGFCNFIFGSFVLLDKEDTDSKDSSKVDQQSSNEKQTFNVSELKKP